MIGTCNSAGNAIDMAGLTRLNADGLSLKVHNSAVLNADNMAQFSASTTRQQRLFQGYRPNASVGHRYRNLLHRSSACWRWRSSSYYALPTKIALEDRSNPADTRGVYVDGSSLLVRPNIDLLSPTNGDFVKVENNRVTAGRYGTTTQLTALKRGGVEFRSGSTVERPDLTITYDDA
jgi:hypothetical protein